MSSRFKSVNLLLVFVLAFGLVGLWPAQEVKAANDIRISQVYGGGGNSGATLKSDFIELFNAGTNPVSVAGWSIQYASATGNTWSATNLTGTILPGKYYLIKEADGTGGTVYLPNPEATGNISMGASSGKVALVNSTTLLTGACPTGLVDFVGYGTANCFEGSATLAPGNTTAAIRNAEGCTDTDNNLSDFTSGAPTARNGAHPAHLCGTASEDSAPTVSSTLPANGGSLARTDNLVITFSEPVTLTDPWFTLSCATSGSHSAAVSDADPVFTLDPETDFTGGESCTLTIDHTKVVDDDTDDAVYDAMLADFVLNFTASAACGDPFTPIYEIQGTGDISPLANTNITTEGVVVGDFQTGGKNGYYIQDLVGDGNDATSDGVFVYNTATAVNPGDRVRVSGKAVEYYNLTEISPVTQVIICSTGNSVTPTDVTLPVTAISDFEKYESMLVRFPQELIISEYFNFDRYGEIVLTSQRHMTPTALVEPGADAQAEAAAYLLDRITLDDGRTTQNPDPAYHPNGAVFNMDNLFRGGGLVQNATGVLDYYQSLYRLQPTSGATYTPANPRTSAPDVLAGDLKVASFNVLNYFVTLDGGTGSWICGPDGVQECRGADTAEEFTRQRAKILSALSAIDADIFGLMEIENEHPGGEDAVADLVAGLNEIKGAGTYAYIQTGAIGSDAIKQAILYKPAAVTPVGSYQLLTSDVDARFIDTLNRPALAQVFEASDGTRFVVAVNHLKSKGSACTGDPDLGDGQGNCNLTRKAAAQALVDWLANPVYFPDTAKALIIGDLNSYDKEDPIDMIKLGADDTPGTADDFSDMVFVKRGENAYGYVYDGQIGYLDHALANAALAENVLDVNFWHINADEPDLIDYDMSFKQPAQDALYAPDAYRSSDHDPVVVSLTFSNPEMQNVTPTEGAVVLGPEEHFILTIDAFDEDLNELEIDHNLEGTLPEFSVYASESDPYGGDGDEFAAIGVTVVYDAEAQIWTIDFGADVTDMLIANGGITFYMVLNDSAGNQWGSMYSVTPENTFVYTITLDDIAPEMAAGVARSASHGDVIWEDGKFTVDEGYVVDTIEITMSEPVQVALGTVVTMEGYGPYGTVTALSGALVTITPYAGNETAALVGTFSFTVPAGSVTDLKGNAFSGSVILEVLDITPPEISSGLAKSLAAGDVIWQDGKFTVDQGYVVDTIEITMSEPVQVALGTVVTMEGYGPYGTVTALSSALVTITPYAGNETAALVGTFSFTVPAGSLTDLSGNAFSGNVTLEVLNIDPIAANDQYQTLEDTPLVVAAPGVLANDEDFDLSVLQALVVAGPAHGTLNLAADGSFVYTPAANYTGPDSFTYKANDGLADSNTATVTLTVTPVNDAPQAVDDVYEVNEDGQLVIAAPGVMANDIEVDPDGIAVTLLTDVSHGSLILLGDGSFTYQPDPNFNGSDSFVYQLVTYPQTQSMWTDEATVTITVLPVNDTPVAVGDVYSTDEDVVLSVPAAGGVLANDSDIDGDTLSAVLVDSTAYGTLDLAADGSFVYTPAANYYGPDSFTYKASDGQAESALVTVQLTVNPLNDAPVAQADTYNIDEDGELTVAAPGVLANDSDADGDALVVELFNGTTHGSLTLNADGSFTYTPDENFFGVDTFTYRVSDENGGQDEAEVTIRVGTVNDWPIANDDAYETVAGVTLIKGAAEGLLVNDILLDPDETVTLTLISEPQHGTLTLNDDGSFTYVPDPTFFGVETFIYQLNSTIQPTGEFSDTATVTITVHPAVRLYMPLVNR